jgi:uncharacterized tellurite resistance protein B-like protein
MTIWSSFKDFVARIAGEDQRAQNLREEELKLAAAALLINAASVDGHFDPEERTKLKQLLKTRFALEGDGLKQVLGEAEAWEHESVDLYSFTSVLARELDQDGRKRIVEMLWEIAYADGVLHEFESNLVWRSAELLGVSDRDRIALRKAVESRL